nr:J domain-containing protein [Vibrio cyclitrophicus]
MWENEDFFSQADDENHFEPSHHQASDALYSDKQITKLYRQLAKQLHPDKETDEKKKSEKSALMQQLLQAKKNKDVVALFILAQQQLPEHVMVMDEDKLERLTMTMTMTEISRSFEKRVTRAPRSNSLCHFSQPSVAHFACLITDIFYFDVARDKQDGIASLL